MSGYGLVIRGGKIFTPEGIVNGDICISEGKIASLGMERSAQASRIIDASGMLVLPGLIDCHVHFRDPGLTYKEDFETGSRGAAAGGVTTVFDMPNTVPVVSNAERFREKVGAVQNKSVVDFGLIAAASADNLPDIQGLSREGAIAFKTFTISPPRAEEQLGSFVTDSGQLYLAMEEVRKTGLVHCIHAESESSVACLSERMRSEGRKDPMAHYDSRPNFTEAEAVSDALIIAGAIGAKIHIAHLSTSEAAELVGWAKNRGINASAETCPQYLYFTKEILNERGPYGKYNPPSRTSDDPDFLISSLEGGAIDMVSSDHAPHTKEEKEAGREDIFRAPSGTPGVETRLPLILTLASKGRLDLDLIPKITSENVARRFGLFPQKGAISVGSDADLAIVDYANEWTIDASKLQTKAWECVIFDGMKVRGKTKFTLLRGEVVFEEGVGFAKCGTGKMLKGNPSLRHRDN